MTFTDLAKSYVRTVIPVLVGLVVSLALRAGIDLHGYTPEITGAVTAVYYMAARAAEHYLSPRYGWLLGVAAAPKYPAKKQGAPSRARYKPPPSPQPATSLVSPSTRGS